MEEIRIAVVGLGHRALHWIRLLQSIPGYRIVALCDPIPALVERGKESVEDATARILRERTSLSDPHFQFLSVIGHADRQFREEMKGFIEQSGYPWREDYWINDRFISLAYYSLVNIQDTDPVPGVFDQAVAWFPMDDLPDMWMDHQAIALKARARLRQDIHKDPIAHKLLPSPFTMPELHRLHQAFLGERIDRSRFQKKMLATGLFERLPRLQKETPGQNPYQYILRKD